MRKIGVAAAVAGAIGLGAAAQQPARPPQNCLHGPSENADQSARRSAALQLARQVNPVEAQANQQGHTFYALSDLPGLSSEMNGFKVQLSTDGGTYTFSIKDTLDPCRFAYFSDQEGVIYSGMPVR
jgi:GvpH